LKRFFEPAVMRRYRPDYVAPAEYDRRLSTNLARASLVETSRMSWVGTLESPRLRFPRRSEADLARLLTEAQKQAARLEPKVNRLYEHLKRGEQDRDKEASPRWQAGYDLAIGRVLAVKVRTEGYNAILAKAKRGLKFRSERSDTWVLQPSDDISVGSQLKKLADKARMYLNRVVEEHPATPWALLAGRELESPMGWTWQERFTGVNTPPPAPLANNPPPPRPTPQPRMLPPPKPKRPPPRL
jgi:hypothetical protein